MGKRNSQAASNASRPKPDVSLLWDKYSLDPFTGRFHCRQTDYPYRGNRCGGCHQLSISGEHRYPYGVCVFAWVNGRWPHSGHHIDHINFNPFDQRPWNIQELSAKKNMSRRGPRRKHNHLQLPGPAWALTGHSLHLMQKENSRRAAKAEIAIQVVTTISTEVMRWWA
jgi:hypothetical protein